MDSFNVIIADDHEIFRKGLAYTLKRTGLVEKIFHAGNGLEVLKLLNTNSNIHLVLMDIRMPEMDGIETTRQIRIQDNQTKILALSMMNDKATIKQMIKAGANGYLLKNTTKLELTDAIQELMKGHKYFSREVSDVLNSHIYQDQPLPQKPFHSSILSQSEKDVLILICHQYSSREISEMLCLSEKTIEGKRKSLFEKTKSKNIAGLVWYAIEAGIIKGKAE